MGWFRDAFGEPAQKSWGFGYVDGVPLVIVNLNVADERMRQLNEHNFEPDLKADQHTQARATVDRSFPGHPIRVWHFSWRLGLSDVQAIVIGHEASHQHAQDLRVVDPTHDEPQGRRIV